MKRTIALICAAVLIALSFTACKNNNYVDDKGVSHTLVMKKGEPIQDEYGNLVEKYIKDGEKVTAPIPYPVVTQSDKHTIQNAVLKLNIPDGWEFDESVKAVRLHHKDCGYEGVCEINVEIQDRMNLDEVYKHVLAAQEVINLVSGEEVVTGDIKQSETKIFGLKTKIFESPQRDNKTYMYYVFYYERYTVGFSFIMNNDCFDKSFDPEAFIKENVTLKKIPTE